MLQAPRLGAQVAQNFARCVCEAPEVFLAMRGRYENGLLERWRQEKALIQHPLMKAAENLVLLRLHVTIVSEGSGVAAECDTEERARTVDLVWNAVIGEAGAQLGFDERAFRFEAVIEAGTGEYGEVCQSGRHGQRIGGEGARLEYCPIKGYLLHVGSPAAISAHRGAASYDLAEGDEIRVDTECRADRAIAQTESRYHLVEDQQAAMLIAKRAQAFNKCGPGFHQAHVGRMGLHQHRSDRRAMQGERCGELAFVVVLAEQHFTDGLSTDAPGDPFAPASTSSRVR